MFLVLRQGDAIEALQATKTMTASSMPWRISHHEGFAEGRAVGRLSVRWFRTHGKFQGERRMRPPLLFFFNGGGTKLKPQKTT